jgi:LPS sulfotransferase NodH
MRKILVLGKGRSGSNLLMGLLRQLPGCASYGEIFTDGRLKPIARHGEILSALQARLGLPQGALDEDAIRQVRDGDKPAFYRSFVEAAAVSGRSIFATKVFYNQITPSELDRILAEPDLYVLFLVRRRIDRVISGLKGAKAGYASVDTTGIRPVLSLEQLLRHCFDYDLGIERLAAQVRAAGVPHSTVWYDRDLDEGDSARIAAVNRCLTEIGLPQQLSPDTCPNPLPRQDRGSAWQDKIANGRELSLALSDLGLFTYMHGTPLVDEDGRLGLRVVATRTSTRRAKPVPEVTDTPREIIVLCMPRSGSNLLSALLGTLPGCAGFYEIFQSGQIVGLDSHPRIAEGLARRMGVDEKAANSAPLLSLRNFKPAQFFDELTAAARDTGKTLFSAKIFPTQIPAPELGRILDRPGLRVIFLARTRAHRAASRAKQHETGKSTRQATTDVLPQMALSDFLYDQFRLERRMEDWLELVQEKGVSHTILHYEQDVDTDAATRKLRIESALAAIGCNLRLPSGEAPSWLVKQDHGTEWRAKIVNGREVERALSALGLSRWFVEAPLTDRIARATERTQGPLPVVARPIDLSADPEATYGYFRLHSREPLVTLSAIQHDRSPLAGWMCVNPGRIAQPKGLHILRPTWAMEGQSLDALAAEIRYAETVMPGHRFVVLHATPTEAARYRGLGIATSPAYGGIFEDEDEWSADTQPHPSLPDATAFYIASLVSWKRHNLASGLSSVLCVYSPPAKDGVDIANRLAVLGLPQGFAVNHALSKDGYHYLNPSEIAQVAARSRVALALSAEEGHMRGCLQSLLCGLPVLSTPARGGRDAIFTADTALLVEPRPEAVAAGVGELIRRGLSRATVRRATLARLDEHRRIFIDAINRFGAELLGPGLPDIRIEPLKGSSTRYCQLRTFLEKLL